MLTLLFVCPLLIDSYYTYISKVLLYIYQEILSIDLDANVSVTILLYRKKPR